MFLNDFCYIFPPATGGGENASNTTFLNGFGYIISLCLIFEIIPYFIAAVLEKSLNFSNHRPAGRRGGGGSKFWVVVQLIIFFPR
ncbi:MAG: hypothetical protein LBR79_05305 [Oscillospiraceae bacterium]|jgi:hypothetical protein|nr:hypothetical protein [Oscillospiraceae bacterium]